MSEIVEHFCRIATDDPSRTLIVLPGRNESMTAGDIWQDCQRAARSLSSFGLASGDLVICAIGNRAELVPFLLACRALDLTLLAVDTGATASEITALSTRFGAKAVLTAGPAMSGDREVVTIGPGLILRRRTGDVTTYPGVAILKLTSGSSGPPRAARTTDAQLVADGRQISTTMGIGREDRQLAAISLAHSYGLGVIVMPLLLQGTAMILHEAFMPPQLATDAVRFGARCLPGVPFMFDYFVEHEGSIAWPRNLRLLISAGARLSPATQRAFFDRFGTKIHTFYGTTETGGITYDAGDAIDDAPTVGCPLSGVSISIRPEDGLPAGTGRVHVRSPAVAHGYAGADSGDFDDQGFLTADYGTVDGAGCLALAGRVSSFINVAGRKVQPEEVEAVVREHPAVLDVRILAAADGQRGEQVVACVMPRTGIVAPTLVEIRHFCSTRLSAHKIPRRLVVVNALPLTTRGKIDRVALAALAQDDQAGHA